MTAPTLEVREPGLCAEYQRPNNLGPVSLVLAGEDTILARPTTVVEDVGHVFNVVNKNGVIYFLDGQTGGLARLENYGKLFERRKTALAVKANQLIGSLRAPS